MLNVKTGLLAGMMAFALVGCNDDKPADTTASVNNDSQDNWTHWVCEGKTTVDWREVEGQDAIDVRMGGDDIVYRLEESQSGSGALYTDGRLTFHTKGDTGILYWNENDENIDVDCKAR